MWSPGMCWRCMYRPSLQVTLIARFGVEKIVAAGLVILAGAGAVALQGVELENFFIALVLLGIGWNFGFIGATTMLAGAHESYERGRMQGLNDLLVFGGVTMASLASGGLMNCSGRQPGGRLERSEHGHGPLPGAGRRRADVAGVAAQRGLTTLQTKKGAPGGAFFFGCDFFTSAPKAARHINPALRRNSLCPSAPWPTRSGSLMACFSRLSACQPASQRSSRLLRDFPTH